MHVPNIKALGFVVSDKKISKVFIFRIYFSLWDLDDYLKKWNKEGHIKTVSAKFGKLPSHPVV